MRVVFFIAATLLQTWVGAAYTIKPGGPFMHTRQKALAPKGGRDCGKFVIYCENAAGACNNACYYIECFNQGSAKMIFHAGQTNDRNRKQSGRHTANSDVCNEMPFSQFFHDPFGSDLHRQMSACDEWPRVMSKQDDFKEGIGGNSLRCTPTSENSCARAQLAAFMGGTNKQGPQRTCDGDITDGDYWTIEFNYDNTVDSLVEHCMIPESCDTDPFPFC